MAEQQTVGSATPVTNTRRSQRVVLVMRITMIWSKDGGLRVRELAETEVISAHGALLRSNASLAPGTHVTLFNPRNNERVNAKVISQGQQGPDSLARFVVELLEPSAEFWGVSFPPCEQQEAAVAVR